MLSSHATRTCIHICTGSRQTGHFFNRAEQLPHTHWWPHGTAACDLGLMKQMIQVVWPPMVDSGTSGRPVSNCTSASDATATRAATAACPARPLKTLWQHLCWMSPTAPASSLGPADEPRHPPRRRLSRCSAAAGRRTPVSSPLPPALLPPPPPQSLRSATSCSSTSLCGAGPAPPAGSPMLRTDVSLGNIEPTLLQQPSGDLSLLV